METRQTEMMVECFNSPGMLATIYIFPEPMLVAASFDEFDGDKSGGVQKLRNWSYVFAFDRACPIKAKSALERWQAMIWPYGDTLHAWEEARQWMNDQIEQIFKAEVL